MTVLPWKDSESRSEVDLTDDIEFVVYDDEGDGKWGWRIVCCGGFISWDCCDLLASREIAKETCEREAAERILQPASRLWPLLVKKEDS